MISKWIFALVQFFPLSVFATFAFWNGMPSNDRWLEAFQLGALLGLTQLIMLLPQTKPLNRLVLAGNIYLILGGFAAFFQQWWYLRFYDVLRESAIIALMVAVGITTTLFSTSGFVAVKNGERKYSVYLLTATIPMLPLAMYFEGDRIYSAVLPIVFLAILQRYLSYKANKTINYRNLSSNIPSTLPSVLPPNVTTTDKVILFDGVCKLCNAWSNFIIKHDREHVFKLCSVQSEEGKKILLHFGFSTDSYETMLYVEGEQFHQQSDAFFQVVSKLGYPWKLMGVFELFPRILRNWIYDRIALNRYNLFGKYDYCTLPTADHEARYLNSKLE